MAKASSAARGQGRIQAEDVQGGQLTSATKSPGVEHKGLSIHVVAALLLFVDGCFLMLSCPIVICWWINQTSETSSPSINHDIRKSYSIRNREAIRKCVWRNDVWRFGVMITGFGSNDISFH